MTKRLTKKRTHNASRPARPGVDGICGQQEGREQPLDGPAFSSQEQALALHMGLPGTRLDMVLGGPHPLLVQLVRAMARTAAQTDHAAALVQTADVQPPTTED